jgi:hypothetical protein
MSERFAMRKIILVSTLSLVLACQGLSVASTPLQTGSEETQTPHPVGQTPESPTAYVSTPIPIVPIPVSSVQIEGMPYLAYQNPGDPFRFVCPESCPLDPQFIFAEYAGFQVAHAKLIELTGVDTLAELQPVDMHLVMKDSICHILPGGHAYIYAGAHQAYTCTEGPGYYPSLEERIRMAVRPDEQYFPLHEYMHTIFFGRISGQAGEFQAYIAESMHDFVVPIPSYAIGILDPAGFCSYHDPNPPGDFSGWLIYELCRQNGFQLPDLALSLTDLDNLYQSGGGKVVQEGFQHPAPTVAQYRDILNGLLGGDTTQAFADACWPPELLGKSVSRGPACPAPTPTISGTPTTVP